MALEAVAIGAAIGSVCLSAFTAWATLLRGGNVKMTQPAVIYFGPDGGRARERKVFLRTLLYSTGHKGRIIEGMFIRLHRGEATQVFNIWVHGAAKDQLIRGSGLKVGPDGLVMEHHFLLPKADRSRFEFQPGNYILEAHAMMLGKRRSRLLFSCDLNLTAEQGAAIQTGESGVYFDWGPNSHEYHASIDQSRLKSEPFEEALLRNMLEPGAHDARRSKGRRPSKGR